MTCWLDMVYESQNILESWLESFWRSRSVAGGWGNPKAMRIIVSFVTRWRRYRGLRKTYNTTSMNNQHQPTIFRFSMVHRWRFDPWRHLDVVQQIRWFRGVLMSLHTSQFPKNIPKTRGTIEKFAGRLLENSTQQNQNHIRANQIPTIWAWTNSTFGMSAAGSDPPSSYPCPLFMLKSC